MPSGGFARTPTRRAFLRHAGAAVLAAGALPALLLACDGDAEPAADAEPGTDPPESPDAELVDRALRDAVDLAASYAAALKGHKSLRRRLAGPRDEIREHVDVLSGAARETPANPDRNRPAPRSRRAARRELIAAERAALHRRRRDAGAAESGELGRLFAAIAACHAQHVELFTGDTADRTTSALGSGDLVVDGGVTVVNALNDALAGEHAALYAYGVIGGRLDEDSRPVRDATEAWETHQRRRADLTSLVEAGGGTPVGAEPGYELPTAVETRSDARQVAQQVEDRCGVLYAGLAATATTGPLRAFAVEALIDAATRAVRWGAPTSPLPGVGTPAG